VLERAVLFTIAISVCSPAAAATRPPTPDQRTLASAAPFIDRANREWSRAIVTGDVAVLSAP
jgi:hypothetical protein